MLAPGDTNGDFDVFVHDIQLGTTRLLSRGLSGSLANGMSGSPRISADGRWIVAGVDPLLLLGTRVFGQFWYRDPGHPPGAQFGLTDAVDLTIGP